MNVFYSADVPRQRQSPCSPPPSSNNLFRGWILPGLCLLESGSAGQYYTQHDGKPDASRTVESRRTKHLVEYGMAIGGWL